MKNVFTILIALISMQSFAQRVYEQGRPLVSDANSSTILLDESVFVTPRIENPKNHLGPYIAAKTMLSNLSEKDLEWSVVNSMALGTVQLTIAKATSVNVILNGVVLPEGSRYYLITENGNNGPFSTKNIQDGSFSHFPIESNTLKIQFELPLEDKENLKFKISEINASFGNALKDGTCNIASVCDDANNYRKAQKSTVIISVNGSGFCTGTLVNNTSRDFTPYIITAQHCLGGSSDLSNWTFAFNYEAKACESKNLNNNKSISLRGADIVAQNAKSDFALLLLREDLGPNDSVHFAGWNKEQTSPNEQHVYHHPNGALKRFSLNENQVTATTYLESNAPPFVWKVDKWEKGTTEGGSSGSSLMNEQGHIIGTLVGGEASCNNINAADYFGRMDVGFGLNDDWALTLSPWLDPNQGNYDSIDGRDYPYSTLPNTDLAIRHIYDIPSTSCDGLFKPRILVKNVGKNAVGGYSLNIDVPGQDSWTPVESIKTLQPGETMEYSFEERLFEAGATNFTVQLNTANDSYTKNNVGYAKSNVLEDAQTVIMSVTVDAYGSENSWEIYNNTGELVISGGPYPNDKDGTTYDSEFCLEKGCYVLKFKDSYGDGMCCDYGDGSFELKYANGNTIAQGYDGPTNASGVPEEQSESICIMADNVEQNVLKNLVVAPNPVLPGESIVISNLSEIQKIDLFSLDGKRLLSSNGSEFNAPNTKGVYLIKVDGYKAKRLIVQ
jgi:hypothetical protein